MPRPLKLLLLVAGGVLLLAALVPVVAFGIVPLLVRSTVDEPRPRPAAPAHTWSTRWRPASGCGSSSISPAATAAGPTWSSCGPPGGSPARSPPNRCPSS
jgi:hypothetical protein